MLPSIAPACDKPFCPRGEAIPRNLDEIVILGGSPLIALDRWKLKPESARRACERAGRSDLARLIHGLVSA